MDIFGNIDILTLFTLAMVFIIGGGIFYYCFTRLNILEDSVINQGKILKQFLLTQPNQNLNPNEENKVEIFSKEFEKLDVSDDEDSDDEDNEDEDGDDEDEDDNYEEIANEKALEQEEYDNNEQENDKIEKQEVKNLEKETNFFENLGSDQEKDNLFGIINIEEKIGNELSSSILPEKLDISNEGIKVLNLTDNQEESDDGKKQKSLSKLSINE